MKLIKLTAAAMSVLILLTGCGQAAVSSAYAASITTTAAVQHTDAEPVYTPPAQEYAPV